MDIAYPFASIGGISLPLLTRMRVLVMERCDDVALVDFPTNSTPAACPYVSRTVFDQDFASF